MTVGIKDVASQAGVSITTVSHVINNTRPVAEETRERVLAAMRELGYYANASARLLKRGTSNTFGLIISDVENPFYPELIKTFEIGALDHGYEVLLCTTNYHRDQAAQAVQRMIENRALAVAVLTSQLEADLLAKLEERKIPVVVLDGVKKRGRSALRIDFSRGAAEAVEHLYGLGHREIAILTGPRSRRSIISYLNALEAGLAARGLSPSVVIEGNNRVDGGAEAAGELLKRDRLPTAILCGHDLAAIGVIQALTEAGLSVPGDVSVVGSDDVPFARYINPALTTVKIPRDQLGQLALDALQKLLRTRRRLGEEYAVETGLVVRQSTGPARTSGGRKR